MHCSPFIYSSLLMVCQALVVWLTVLKSFFSLMRTWSEWCYGVVILSHTQPPSSQESSLLPNLNCKHDKCFFLRHSEQCLRCVLVALRATNWYDTWFQGGLSLREIWASCLKNRKVVQEKEFGCPFFAGSVFFFLLLVHCRFVQTQSS